MENIELTKEPIVVLYVDDEENNLLSFKASFRRNFVVHTAINTQEAREILSKEPVSICISDQRMPLESGVEFLKFVRNQYPGIVRILLTGYSDLNAVIDAINQAEIFRYLTKPWNDQDMIMTINSGYEIIRLKKENKTLLERLMDLNEQLEFLARQSLID